MSENLSKIDEIPRRVIEMTSELIGHESSGEVNSFLPEWPRVSIRDISMPNRKTAEKLVTEWLEDLLSSSANIEKLAESSLGVIGNGDEDLRIREMTSEEGASLKKYMEITQMIMHMKRFSTVSFFFTFFFYPLSCPCIFFFRFSVFSFFSKHFFFPSFFRFFILFANTPDNDRTRRKRHPTNHPGCTKFPRS